MKAIIYLPLFFLSSLVSIAQNEQEIKPAIVVIARNYGNSIELRYFPSKPALLSKGYQLGYHVERANFQTGVAVENLSFSPIKGSPFLIWDEKQWEAGFKDKNNIDSTQLKLAGFAKGLSDSSTNGKVGDVLDGGLKSIKEERDNQDMKFAFAIIAANRSKMAAQGLALRVTDTEVSSGAEYVYRVSMKEKGTNNVLALGYTRIKAGSFNPLYLKNNQLIKLVEGDKMISISFPDSKEYYAYNIERSDNQGVTYQRITTEPALKLKAHGYTGQTEYGFSDSGLVNYQKYFYRVLVSTPFADDLLLAEFVALPRDKTPPPAPLLQTATHIKPKQVELIWEMPKEPNTDLKGFKINRSNEIKGVYSPISKSLLPITTRRYIDESFEKDGSNYYIVEAIDTAGNINQSFPLYVTLIDSTPPAIPTISFARIDSLGKITIQIKPNIEKDFMGYQLLKANAKEHNFSIVEETFKDSTGTANFTLVDSTTLNTLTKNIYYRVIAFDTHFNQSEPSKIIELTKRDTIPPVSPLIAGFHITDSTVVIEFANSSSEDASKNLLLRREKGKEKFDTIFVNNKEAIVQFTDKNITGGVQYEYAMYARDAGGLLSKSSNHIFLKTILNNRIPTPQLIGKYNQGSKQLLLDFILDGKTKNGKIMVELFKRSAASAVWVSDKLIEYMKGKQFVEQVPTGSKSMIYCIRLIDEQQRVSNFSNEVELKF
jgi:hypothetical protein